MCTHEDAVCGEGALKLPLLRVRLVLVLLPALRLGLTCSPRRLGLGANTQLRRVVG